MSWYLMNFTYFCDVIAFNLFLWRHKYLITLTFALRKHLSKTFLIYFPVTKHCPLQLPLMGGNLLECYMESDCPIRSTCCLDMRNKKYCRRIHED